MRRVPRSIPEDRFDELLTAATAVVRRAGLPAHPDGRRGRALGVAKGTVYTYVASKEALLDCVLRHADRDGARRDAGAPAGGDARPARDARGLARARYPRRRPAARCAPRSPASGSATCAPSSSSCSASSTTPSPAIAPASSSSTAARPTSPSSRSSGIRAGRRDALSLLARYLDARSRRGRLRRFDDLEVAARLVLETLVFWAVHRHWDPSPQIVDEVSARQTVLAFLTAALVKET